MKKRTILLAGHCSLDPLGRHIISFIKSLLENNSATIVIERSYLLNEYTTLNQLFKNEISNGIVKFDTDFPSDFLYDFLIFTDSISLLPYQHWEKRLLNYNAKIKICYPVYDGSVPPLHWIEIINESYDICLCTSEYCAHNLKRYGVSIDCFCLECSVLIEDFLNIKKQYATHKPFRFGSIGASDFRKNLPLLIRSFNKAFSKNDNVELFIHSSYGKDITCKDDLHKTYEEVTKQASNIILQTKLISHDEMIKLWASFDAYISPQTTTGYFTTPLEACAVGIPVILSDIHPHKELKKFVDTKNNLFFVKHDKISPAFHWVFDYRMLGCKFDGNEQKYIEAMQYVYEHREELKSERLVQARKHYAEQLCAKKLAFKYQTLVSPEQIAISEYPHIEGNTFFMSKALSKKYAREFSIYPTVATETYTPTVYPEEDLTEFKVIEECSVQQQQIFLKAYCQKLEHVPVQEHSWRIMIKHKIKTYLYHHTPLLAELLFSFYKKMKGIKNRIWR